MKSIFVVALLFLLGTSMVAARCANPDGCTPPPPPSPPAVDLGGAPAPTDASGCPYGTCAYYDSLTLAFAGCSSQACAALQPGQSESTTACTTRSGYNGMIEGKALFILIC